MSSPLPANTATEQLGFVPFCRCRWPHYSIRHRFPFVQPSVHCYFHAYSRSLTVRAPRLVFGQMRPRLLYSTFNENNLKFISNKFHGRAHRAVLEHRVRFFPSRLLFSFSRSKVTAANFRVCACLSLSVRTRSQHHTGSILCICTMRLRM